VQSKTTIFFRTLALDQKRGRTCRRRSCERTPQWLETKRDTFYGGGTMWCDEHAMERLRKLHKLWKVSVSTERSTLVTGDAHV
jgi:hypothetical protein